MSSQQTATATTYERWLSKCLNNERTAAIYRNAVTTFLRCVYGSDDERPETLAPRYLSEVKSGQRIYFDDLVDYVDAANGKTPPNTISTTLAGIQSFMTWCSDVELTSRQKAQLKSKRGRGTKQTVTEKGNLDRTSIRQLLSHCDVKMKALVLFLESSGVRIEEALQLKDGDLHTDSPRTCVHIKAEISKTRRFRRTFISSEAREALDEWLKVREEHIVLASKVSENFQTKVTTKTADYIFPFGYTTVNQAFTEALKNAGMFQLTNPNEPPRRGSNRKTITLHRLRAYFLTTAKSSKLNPAIAEFLAGHAGPEKGAYDGWEQWPDAKLCAEYIKAESAILVSAGAEKLEGMENLETINNSLMAELQDLRERVKRQEEFNQKWMNASTDELAEIGRRVLKARIAESSHVEMGPD